VAPILPRLSPFENIFKNDLFSLANTLVYLYNHIIMVIQARRSKARFSRLRDELKTIVKRMAVLIEPFMGDHPLVKGTVYELKRRCGKPGCRCQKGHLHATMVLVASEGGRKKLRVIPKGSLVEVKIKAGRYRKVRVARAEFIKLARRAVAVMDKMETMRREEME